MRKVLGFAAVVFALVATSATAQEAIEIKDSKPKVGDKAKSTIEEKSESKTVANAGGMDIKKDETKTKSLVYVDEVLAVTDGDKKPTKLKRTYEKAVATDGDNETTLPVAKKTILIEKKGDKYTYTIDGKDAGDEIAKFLDSEFNKKEDKDERDLFIPKKPVKPGETWKIDTDVIAKGLGENFKLDKSKLEATGKLVKAYKQDGKQFGVIEIKITGPITELPKVPVKVSSGTLTTTVTADGVLDGSSPQGKSTMQMKLVVEGSGKGFDLKVEVTNTQNRTTAPVK